MWQAGVEAADRRGLRVLSCRPVEAEAKLAFAALADLLDRVADAELSELPGPQRVALEVALLRAAPSGAAVDGRAVGTALVSLLRRIAADETVVLAVDDAQWLDRGSASVLGFALRRMHQASVRALVAVRTERGEEAAPFDVGQPPVAERVQLGPLSLSSLYHVLRAQLEQVFPRPTLQRIARASGGNPLFAVELARSLLEADARPGPVEPLPVPETLAELLEARIRRLPRLAREALLAAAALTVADVALIEQAIGGDVDEALAAAEQAGVVRMREGRLRFTHPLFASTVYSAASAARRRTVHSALADAVADDEQRARHLALAANGPDEAVAVALDAATRDAAARGASEVAVELAELACTLTPSEQAHPHARRTLALIEYLFRAGDTERARASAEAFVEVQEPGPLLARALELLARILHVAGTASEAAACGERALAEAGDDLELQARVHATLAAVSFHDFRIRRRHGRAAFELAESLDNVDPVVLSEALWTHIAAEFEAGGEQLPLEAIEQALALERASPAPHVADRISSALGVWFKLQGDFVAARRWLEATRAAAIAEGDDASLPYALSHLPQLELWTGNWKEAEAVAREHLDLAEQMAQPTQRRQALFNLSLVHAHLGRVEEARATVGELLREADAAGDEWDGMNALTVLGFVELSTGDAPQACAALGRAVEIREAMAVSEPIRAHADYAEALVLNDELDAADEVVRILIERARSADRAAILAVAARSRALLAAARQDLDGAVAAIDDALVQHARVTVPFDEARTLLAAGGLRRRRGERRAAKDALERARAIFDELGAPLWASRAEAELRRIPIRRGASEELTPTEERVAELAASGLTNREVAQRLFMSPKTVAANLSRVYRKLAIGSRAELGATMAVRNQSSASPKT